MLQQVITESGKTKFHEVPMPEVSDREVLIKIMKAGICGSDIHVHHGERPFTSYLVTQEHEISGEVVKAGRAVTGLKPGQKMIVQSQVVYGQYYPCCHGKYNLCEDLRMMGFQTAGVVSRYFVMNAAKVTLFPDDMSYDGGTMIEPLAIAAHAVRQAGDVKGTKVAVLGTGPIGILVAWAAKGLRAEQMMITDVSGLRLEKAKERGVNFCVNTRNKDLGKAMTESLGPNKAEVIYNCADNNITMGQVIKYTRKGSTIILVTVFAGLGQTDLAMLNDHELDLNTSMMYWDEDYLDAIHSVNEKKVVLSPLTSRHFVLGDYLGAYRYIDENRGSTMKVIINMQEQIQGEVGI